VKFMPHLSTISKYQIILDQTNKLFLTFEKSWKYWKSLFGLHNRKIRLKIIYRRMGHLGSVIQFV